eukprot:13651092-Ditylum_brightwellii.AAC.1
MLWHGKEALRKDLKIHLKKLTVVSTEGRLRIAKDTMITVRMPNQVHQREVGTYRVTFGYVIKDVSEYKGL